jgi:hypothetical protein
MQNMNVSVNNLNNWCFNLLSNAFAETRYQRSIFSKVGGVDINNLRQITLDLLFQFQLLCFILY